MYFTFEPKQNIILTGSLPEQRTDLAAPLLVFLASEHYTTSQALLAGVQVFFFFRGSVVFVPPTDWPVRLITIDILRI